MRAISGKSYFSGTHRHVSPAETLRRVSPYLREMGITRVANVTGMDSIGIHTVVVSRPNARSLSVSQGKGFDIECARASGVMEAIEHHCAEHIERPLRLARPEELERAVRIADIGRLPRGPRSGELSRLLWIEADELISGEPTWLPYELVHLDLTLPLPEGSGFFLCSSNGLASGNDLQEATVHAVCELIERDATTLFYDSSAEEQWRRRVANESVDDPWSTDLLQRYERAGIDVAIWNTTSDIGVASFLCSVLDRDLDPFRPVGPARGAGCHPDRGVALARALSEAAQSRLTRISGARDDIAAEDHARIQSEARIAVARAQMDVHGVMKWDEIPTRSRHTFDEELDWLEQQLLGCGVAEILRVELQPPWLPVSVVRVVVPGLEPPSEIPNYRPGARLLCRRGQPCLQ